MDDQLFPIEDIEPKGYQIDPPNLTAYEKQKQVRAMAHTLDPNTSFKAASKVVGKMRGRKKAVLAVHVEAYPVGLSDEAMVAITGTPTGLNGNPDVKARSSLTKTDHMLKDSGRREVNEAGNEVVIWVLALSPGELGL